MNKNDERWELNFKGFCELAREFPALNKDYPCRETGTLLLTWYNTQVGKRHDLNVYRTNRLVETFGEDWYIPDTIRDWSIKQLCLPEKSGEVSIRELYFNLIIDASSLVKYIKNGRFYLSDIERVRPGFVSSLPDNKIYHLLEVLYKDKGVKIPSLMMCRLYLKVRQGSITKGNYYDGLYPLYKLCKKPEELMGLGMFEYNFGKYYSGMPNKDDIRVLTNWLTLDICTLDGLYKMYKDVDRNSVRGAINRGLQSVCKYRARMIYTEMGENTVTIYDKVGMEFAKHCKNVKPSCILAKLIDDCFTEKMVMKLEKAGVVTVESLVNLVNGCDDKIEFQEKLSAMRMDGNEIPKMIMLTNYMR